MKICSQRNYTNLKFRNLHWTITIVTKTKIKLAYSELGSAARSSRRRRCSSVARPPLVRRSSPRRLPVHLSPVWRGCSTTSCRRTAIPPITSTSCRCRASTSCGCSTSRRQVPDRRSEIGMSAPLILSLLCMRSDLPAPRAVPLPLQDALRRHFRCVQSCECIAPPMTSNRLHTACRLLTSLSLMYSQCGWTW